MRAKDCRKPRGFTLIELLIGVVIVGILTAIAIPAYDSYVTKSKLKSAQSDLVALSLAVENVYQKQLVYPSATASTTSNTRCVAANGTTTCTTSPWQPSQDDSFTYKYSLQTVDNAPLYTVEALGTSGKVNGCSIKLTSKNARTISSCSGYNGNWL